MKMHNRRDGPVVYLSSSHSINCQEGVLVPPSTIMYTGNRAGTEQSEEYLINVPLSVRTIIVCNFTYAKQVQVVTRKIRSLLHGFASHLHSHKLST